MSVSPARTPKRRSKGRGVAFYDLDGTLTELNLLHSTLYFLTNLGEWSARIAHLLDLAIRIPSLYFAERRDRHLLNVALFETYKGLSRDRLEALGDEYCERVLIRHIFPQAQELIEANRAAGLEPVLVTGSPDFIARPLAERLKMRAVAANRLIFSRGQATGRLQPPVLAGDDKAAWCVAWAAANRIDLDGCWGYADSYYDLPFLAANGHPVAVNPDHRLLAAARSRKWPVVRFAKPSRDAGASGGGAIVDAWFRGKTNGAA